MASHDVLFYYTNPQDASSVYERMSVVILGAMLWGLFRGLSIEDTFVRSKIRDVSNMDLIDDDICQAILNKLLRTHNGVHTHLTFSILLKFRPYNGKYDRCSMVDSAGPFLDNIRLIL